MKDIDMVKNYNDVGIIILAAGKGTRMKSDIAKVLHKVGDKTMIAHVIDCAIKIVKDNVIVVVGHQAQAVENEVNKYFKVKFAVQKQLSGTGDAVKAGIPFLKPFIQDVLVLCGDVPLIQEATLLSLLDVHRQTCAKISVLAVDVKDPKGYGRIVLNDHNQMVCIKEEADATEIEKKIKTINTGIYCFDKELLTYVINKIKPDNNQGEYYLTDVIEMAQKKQEKIMAVTMDDPGQVMGVNTLEDLNRAEDLCTNLPNELP